MKWFLFITFLALESIVSINGIPPCGPNQKYFQCGPCEQICDREPQSCTATCGKPGCYCKQGYIRASPCNSSECVLPSNCPGKCGVNEVYKSCGGCDETCNEEPIFCKQDCSSPGCYCNIGYKRASTGRSNCIPESLCSRKQCGINEEYKCGCEQYCNEPQIFCFGCTNGCFCKDGYKRSFRGGICISTSNCPLSRQVGTSSTQNTGQCGVNEVYNSCGGCDQTCNEEPVLCKQDCSSPGCYCKTGYKRASRGRSNCIPESLCQQQQCGVNEVFKECRDCDQYCNEGPVGCAAVCRPGCSCLKGYKRSSRGGACVPISMCQCGVNEVYNSCGGCDQTCNEEPVLCKQDCSSPGCYCKTGYKRASRGRSNCIPESLCQHKQCSVNEEYKCGCEQYCGEPIISCFTCKIGCYCKYGYKRSFPGGVCIPRNTCQGIGSSLPQNAGPARCNPNEISKQCGCDQVCGRNPVICAQKCRPGCYCINGFVRANDAKGSKCIKPEQCQGQQKQCRVNNEEYKCGCEQYCNEPPIFCFICSDGCFCKNGFKRSFRGGYCIPIYICSLLQGIGPPPTQNTDSQTQGIDSSLPQNGGPARCNTYEVFRSCGCDQVCGGNPVFCTQSIIGPQICRPDCYCKNGLVRADNRKGSKCIKPEQCQGQQKPCSVNEEYKCSCEQYCGEPLISCHSCTFDCYCRYGYKRLFGICIPISICRWFQGEGSSVAQITGPSDQGVGSSQTQNRGQQQNCGENEVYMDCGGCDGYCNAGPIACAECQPACYCRKGYVRLSPGGKCVSRSSCPSSQGAGSSLTQNRGQQQPCGLNEVYMACGCDGYCNAGPIACATCLRACYCRKGYVRLSPGGRCVPRSSCPTNCRANEVFMYCGGCDQYCNRGPVSCAAVCSRGCYCKDGYKRSPGGICVLTSTCEPQQQCNVNEIFVHCGGCDQYCNEKPIICTSLACIPGCYCQRGYKRSRRWGICIPTSVCILARVGEESFVEEDGIRSQALEESFNEETDSQSQVVDESFPEDAADQCGKNEVFNQCGVGKQCENYCGRGANACAYCQPGCYCRSDYIRSGPEYDAICIPENQCPRNQDVGLSEIAETGESSGDSSGFESSNSGSRYEDIVTYEETEESLGEWSEYESSNSGSHYEDIVTYETEETSERFGEWSEFESSNSGRRDVVASSSSAQDPEANQSFDQDSQGPGYNCRQDEMFKTCGVGPECENYCGRGANACSYCTTGCYCKEGTIRAGPSNTTRCIPENQCSTAQKCFPNEVYSTCGTACPANCENRNPICTQNCVPGCFCEMGYIRRYADVQTFRYECIPVDQCPS